MTPVDAGVAARPGGLSIGRARCLGSSGPMARPAGAAALSGVLLGLALALHGIEGLLPPLPVPGARLGLANAVSLFVLWRWGGRYALLFGAARVLLGSVLTGRLGSPGFWLACSGALASVAVMTVALGWAQLRPSRIVVLSVLGGVAHNLGQLAAARYLVGHPGVAAFLPALSALGALAGGLVGAFAHRSASALAGPAGSGATGSGAISPPRYGGLPGLVAAAGLLALLAAGSGSPWAAAAIAARRALLPSGVTASAQAGAAVVRVAGRAAIVVPLGVDGARTVDAGEVRMVIEVQGGRVRVRSSSCPDRICVNAGWIDRPGQVIVCVPGRTIVTVEGPGATSAPAGAGEVDAVTR